MPMEFSIAMNYSVIWNRELLFLHGAIQEGHNLTSCAVVAGAEQTAADTAGDLVLLCPRNCVCIVSVRRHIADALPPLTSGCLLHDKGTLQPAHGCRCHPG